jgi:hypothetical protein
MKLDHSLFVEIFIRNLIRIFFLNSSVWFSLDDSWGDATDDPFLAREARPAIV